MKIKTSAALIAALALAISLKAKGPGNIQEKLDTWAQGEGEILAAARVDADGTVLFQSRRLDEGDPGAMKAISVHKGDRTKFGRIENLPNYMP